MLRPPQGQLRQVVTPEGTFRRAPWWLPQAMPPRKDLNTVGIDVPMSNVLIEALVTEMEPPCSSRCSAPLTPTSTVTRQAMLLRLWRRLRLRDGERGQRATTAPPPSRLPAICRGILRYIPKLANARWSALGRLRDVCIDGVPVLGPVDEVPGLVLPGAHRPRLCSFVSPIGGRHGRRIRALGLHNVVSV